MPEVIGAHSDWVFPVGTYAMEESLDWDRVWSEPPSVGDVEDSERWAGHMQAM